MKANTPELMKFKRLQRRLGVSIATLVGHLELLWLSTAKNAPEGDIGRFSNEDIAIACYWDRDPDEFVDALQDCGWLDADEAWRLLVHDWSEHAPSYVQGFLKRHGREFRKPTSTPQSQTQDSTKQATRQVTKQPTKEPPIVASSEHPPTIPSQAKPNQAQSSQALPCQASSVCGVVGEPTTPPKEIDPPSEFDFVLTGGKIWNLPLSKLEEYHTTFPALDIESELRLAAQWVRDNVQNRKTATGMFRYLFGWLSRAQNRGRSSSRSSDNPKTFARQSLENSQQAIEDFVNG